MSGLADFLLARIADDEAVTRILDCNCGEGVAEVDPLPGCPDRVLAECEAKRRIVEECQRAIGTENVAHGRGLARAVRFLALPYADHPDYDEEWRP